MRWFPDGGVAGRLLICAVLLAGTAACDASTVGLSDEDGSNLTCSLPSEQILSGTRRDAIPALTNPATALPGDPGTEYLKDTDRVVGLLIDGEPVAIPLNIFWWHEIVNLDGAESSVAVTHCPLTGSSIAFGRSHLDDVEFGVSGLLFQNNLIMYDRSGGTASLWPQMLLGARCGPRDGEPLPTYPLVETTWRGWTWMYPRTQVVTSETGFDRDYGAYPYGDYRDADSRHTLFPLSEGLDARRPPKELVLGIPFQRGGIAYPFGSLEELGAAAVVTGNGHVVFWEASRQGAMAFHPKLDGEPLTFHAVDGVIRDVQTGSEWRMDGRAVLGPLAGRSLDPIEGAFVAFWFAWPALYPDIEIWTSTGSET